jgi:hypothetical protein
VFKPAAFTHAKGRLQQALRPRLVTTESADNKTEKEVMAGASRMRAQLRCACPCLIQKAFLHV